MLKRKLTAFILDLGPYDRAQEYLSSSPFFQTPGNYSYSIHVYDCAEIEAKLGVSNCGYGEPGIIERILSLTPIKSISKTITVTAAK